ncbi:PDR/VanB family oxidoreductase [Asticcacaulis excentricus]|uniref:Ferredoxin n=1 Tax=Asticcacaulis excentricus (strain ATCC 15261 / DSM 4724 / KCTC 12464 / NCIMB 9791 / VKM B-1370 / CB 48) TaxID=573065 RepID=E8RUS8_ASTEC|nr:PDR/VanB family oxidoreductase [Asticcacaulis excentricus]ADU14128.1 ferredoxin [Asticcacaulis excentricus CB 48]
MSADLRVRVEAIVDTGPAGEAGAVRVFDLRPIDGHSLPAFEAGAHIDIVVREGLVRQYSLFNAPDETHRYMVAVALDAATRGGSKHLHEWVECGDILIVSAPRCHFHLVEDAPFSVFIAGGIGVTPLWAMAQRLLALGQPFSFHYGARKAATAPLLDTLRETLDTNGIAFETAFEADGGARLDLARIIANAPEGTHFYACGPRGMLDAYVAAGAVRPSETIHLERFAGASEAVTEGGFEVELARTGGAFTVPAGQTILETLKSHGINVPHSCAEGICGACECRVIEGTPDHRDSVLTDAEKASGQTMMVCCSGAKSSRLVLDL